MPLKLKLKAREKLLINGALITNGTTPAEIFVENRVPLLRQKDIMIESDAHTHCERIYFLIQLMYFTPENLKELHSHYWALVRQLLAASPSMLTHVTSISESLLEENYYNALKLARKMINYERDIISHAN